MERRDWLLLTIDAGREKGLTPVQLQKSLFLLGQTFPKQVGSSFYKFVPYNYGPFCMDIYNDAESLQQQGLIEIRRASKRWPEYRVSPAGAQQAEKLRGKIPTSVIKYLMDVVSWTQSQTFPELVRTIYEAYPTFRTHSVFRG